MNLFACTMYCTESYSTHGRDKHLVTVFKLKCIFNWSASQQTYAVQIWIYDHVLTYLFSLTKVVHRTIIAQWSLLTSNYGMITIYRYLRVRHSKLQAFILQRHRKYNENLDNHRCCHHCAVRMCQASCLPDDYQIDTLFDDLVILFIDFFSLLRMVGVCKLL